MMAHWPLPGLVPTGKAKVMEQNMSKGHELRKTAALAAATAATATCATASHVGAGGLLLAFGSCVVPTASQARSRGWHPLLAVDGHTDRRPCVRVSCWSDTQAGGRRPSYQAGGGRGSASWPQRSGALVDLLVARRTPEQRGLMGSVRVSGAMGAEGGGV